LAEAEREISGLRSLKHPMICGIFDIVKDKENHPFIIMEKCNQSL
jgi:serine/threonine protein kinase